MRNRDSNGPAKRDKCMAIPNGAAHPLRDRGEAEGSGVGLPARTFAPGLMPVAGLIPGSLRSRGGGQMPVSGLTLVTGLIPIAVPPAPGLTPETGRKAASDRGGRRGRVTRADPVRGRGRADPTSRTSGPGREGLTGRENQGRKTGVYTKAGIALICGTGMTGATGPATGIGRIPETGLTGPICPITS